MLTIETCVRNRQLLRPAISFQTVVKSIFIHVFDHVDIRESFTVKKILYVQFTQFTQTNIHYRMDKGQKHD